MNPYLQTSLDRVADWLWLAAMVVLFVLTPNVSRAATSASVTLTETVPGGTISCTATVFVYYSAPSRNFPTFTGEIRYMVRYNFNGPVDGNTYFYNVTPPNAGTTQAGLGMSYTDAGGVFYNLQNQAIRSSNPGAANGPPSIGSLTLTSSNGGSQTILLPVPLNGLEQNTLGVTVNSPVKLPTAFLQGQGNIVLNVFQNGQLVQQITKQTDGANGTISNTTFSSGLGLTGLMPNAPVSIALDVPGYRNGASGEGIVSGSSGDHANVFLPISNNGATGIATVIKDTDTPIINLGPAVLANLPKLPIVSGNGTPAYDGQPVWINPQLNNGSYTQAGDPLSLSYYQQGVTNMMTQSAEFQNQNQTVWQNMAVSLSDIANNTANISGGGGVGGGGEGNLTVDLSPVVDAVDGVNGTLQGMNATLSSANSTLKGWVDKGNAAAGNSSAFTRGTDASANAAAEANMTASWSGALNELDVPGAIPSADFTTASPESVFVIHMPAAFGGKTIDFNPFRADRLGTIISAFRTALAWLAVVTFAIWALRETFAVIKDSGKLSQIFGPKVIIAAESDGGLVVAASYILMVVGAVVILLSACVAIYDTDWPIIGRFAALFTTGPFHGYPAQVVWMLDQVFPVATCVAVLLGRLTYLKLLAVAYIVYMAFYKSKPA